MSFTFKTVDVKDELVKALKTALVDLGYTGKLAVKVLKADPQTPSELPCIGVNRIDDSETDQSITDSEGSSYNSETREHIQFYGTFFSESMEIRIWHTNADERDKLYQTVRATLFAVRRDLLEKGLLNVSLRGGRDEQDSTMEQAPMVLYWSTITLNYLNPLDVHFTTSVEPITSIVAAGILTSQQN